jgi:hypothetical protein
MMFKKNVDIYINDYEVCSEQTSSGPQSLRFTLSDYPFGIFKLFLIIWLSNISILSVPDKDYSRNASCAQNLISTFLFNIYSYEITIFQKHYQEVNSYPILYQQNKTK